MSKRDDARRRQMPVPPVGDRFTEFLLCLAVVALTLFMLLAIYAPDALAYLLLYWWNGYGRTA